MSYTQEELEAMDINELRKDYETIGKFLKEHHDKANQNRQKPMGKKKVREQIQYHESLKKMTQFMLNV